MFYELHTNIEAIKKVGEAFIKVIYGGSVNADLSHIRFKAYTRAVCQGSILPERLPPTKQAVHPHTLKHRTG